MEVLAITRLHEVLQLILDKALLHRPVVNGSAWKGLQKTGAGEDISAFAKFKCLSDCL